ncbi:MAG: hypothetical protein M3N46_02960 [Actinomycetota bacterium]|nr:hypothetical protein [Actinomycetota bacterium]
MVDPEGSSNLQPTASPTPVEPGIGSREEALPPQYIRVDVPEDRKSVYGRERAEYGGIKFGVAFFGWLTATGLTAILGAVAGAVVAALGIDTARNRVDFGTALTAAIVLLVVLFIAYLAGGYVAGRMARFAGARQGVAVWVWGVVVTGLLAIIAAVAGTRFNILSFTGIIPALSFGPNQALATILTVVGAVGVALLAAILGGLAGMRFHRRVDRAGWESTTATSDSRR